MCLFFYLLCLALFHFNFNILYFEIETKHAVTVHVEGVVGVVQVSPVDIELHGPAHGHRHVHSDHLGGLNSECGVIIRAVSKPPRSFTVSGEGP